MTTLRFTLFGLMLLAIGAGTAAAQTKLEIVLGGGYAVVVTDSHQTLDVGPIRRPRKSAPGYMLHRMKLAVEAGLVDQARTTVPTRRIGVGTDPTVGWDLTGFNVDVLTSSGSVLPNAAIALPAPAPLGATCDEAMPASNNRNFLPDILAMSGTTALVADWKSRLQGRLTLHGGALSVNKLAPGCFTFYQQNTAKDTRRLADGQKGLSYTRDVPGNEVTLKLTDAAGKVAGLIVLRADGGAIRLTINTHDTMNPAPNSMITHFRYFYELVAPRRTQATPVRQIPKWLGVKTTVATPGEACPPGFFEVP